MNQDSHEPDHQQEAAPENRPLDEAQDAGDVEEEDASPEPDEPDEQDEWANEFSPAELAELFGGQEKVPAQVLESRAEVLQLGLEDEDEAEAGAEEEEEGQGERLQKLLARTGVASRRAAEELIRAGRVSVNNEVVTELGRRARAGRDRIAVDGKPLKVPGAGSTVVLLHKPRGCVSTKSDPQNRTTVMAFLPKRLAHLHPVGRLDFDTSGLLLLTDDGDLTNLLLHPSHGVEKRYHARVRGVVSASTIDQLQKGVRLEDGVTLPCRVRVKAQTPSNALLEIVLREGRNRQVRRMLQAVGHPISALRRVRVGPLDMGGLPAGAFRELIPGEVHQLKKAALAPKPALKSARPFAYKPRPSKAEDKTLPQVLARRPARPAPEPADPATPRPSNPSAPRAPREKTTRPSAPHDSSARDSSARPRAPRDNAPRETSSRPHTPRDNAPREGSPREAGRDRIARPYTPRDAPDRGSASRPASRPAAARENSRPADSPGGAPSERASSGRARPGGFNARPDSRRPSEQQAERPGSRPSRPSPRPAAPEQRSSSRDERSHPREERGSSREGRSRDEARHPSAHAGSAHAGSAHAGSSHAGSAHVGSAHVGSAHAGSERAPQDRARQDRPPRSPAAGASARSARSPESAAQPRSARPAPRASERSPERDAAAPRAAAGASRPPKPRAQDGAPRAPGGAGASRSAGAKPKLAKRIEDRWK